MVERAIFRRGLGSPALFAIVYTSVASALYFVLGVVAEHALGLTPLVFVVAALFFVVTTMTYVEGASLHQERAGSTVFARYAFNELWSFVAGWAILLDFLILVAVTAFMTTDYASVLWEPVVDGIEESVLALGVVAYVAVRNVRGFSPTRTRRILALVIADLGLQLLIIVIGLVLLLNGTVDPDVAVEGRAPAWDELLFAATLATVAFTSLESASGLAGEVAVGRAGLKRLVWSVAVAVAVIYVGMSVVALGVLPVEGAATPLGTTYLELPLIGVVEGFGDTALLDVLRYVVAIFAVATLIAC